MAPEPSADALDLDAVLRRLETGPLHRFADFETVADLPRKGAAVYTIWDDEGALVYVGVSGRSATSKTGPWGRLRSHWNGRRSGDQFCVYVADHYVLPELRDQIWPAIRRSAAPQPATRRTSPTVGIGPPGARVPNRLADHTRWLGS
jgi:hypothetical protein